MLHPRVHLACGQAKRHGASKGKDRVFAGEVVRRGLGHLNGAVLQRVHYAKGRHQLTTSVHRHLELAAGQRLDRFGKHFPAAVNGVQRLGKAGSHAPAHSGLGVYGRGYASSEHACDASVLED